MAKENNRSVLAENRKLENEAKRVFQQAQRNTQRFCNHRDPKSGELTVKPVGSDIVRCTECHVEFSAAQYDDQMVKGSAQVLQNVIQFIRAMTYAGSEKDDQILAQLSDLSNDIKEIPQAYQNVLRDFENRQNNGGGRRRGRGNDVYGDRITDFSPGRRWN